MRSSPSVWLCGRQSLSGLDLSSRVGFVRCKTRVKLFSYSVKKEQRTVGLQQGRPQTAQVEPSSCAAARPALFKLHHVTPQSAACCDWQVSDKPVASWIAQHHYKIWIFNMLLWHFYAMQTFGIVLGFYFLPKWSSSWGQTCFVGNAQLRF